MRGVADQAAAAFLQDLEKCPDQLMEQPGFRLKRQVKGLYQVVCDLARPVASILCLKLVCAATHNAEAPTTVNSVAAVGAHTEELEQYSGVHFFTQVCKFIRLFAQALTMLVLGGRSPVAVS